MSMNFPDPPWVSTIEDPRERDIALMRFRLKLAALYFTPNGSLHTLSSACGLNKNTLGSRCFPVSRRTAHTVQALLGSGLFPAGMFVTSDAGPEEQ